MKLVALLRGINVGGHRRVPMADLRDLARELGHDEVETYIQSGNLVLSTAQGKAAAASALTQAIEARFGFPVEVIARTATEWARLMKTNPFPAVASSEPRRLIVHVPQAAPQADAAAALRERAKDGEEVEAAGGAMWIHYREGQGKSRLAPALVDRLLGSPSTARSWTTVLALQALLTGRSTPPER